MPDYNDEIWTWVQANCTKSQSDEFAERAGMCIHDHATYEQADRDAFKQVFGIAFEKRNF